MVWYFRRDTSAEVLRDTKKVHYTFYTHRCIAGGIETEIRKNGILYCVEAKAASFNCQNLIIVFFSNNIR